MYSTICHISTSWSLALSKSPTFLFPCFSVFYSLFSEQNHSTSGSTITSIIKTNDNQILSWIAKWRNSVLIQVKFSIFHFALICLHGYYHLFHTNVCVYYVEQEQIYTDRVGIAKRILSMKERVVLEQWEMDQIPKNLNTTYYLPIFCQYTINCFSKTSQLHTQCVMIHLWNQNIFCQYDLETIKNVILLCDQCHLSQCVEDFAPYYKVLLIEVELFRINPNDIYDRSK